jgi:DNA invertase Pin-like site-specific DNA recombinase
MVDTIRLSQLAAGQSGRTLTQRQGQSGLGLEAQRAAVSAYLPASGGYVRATFTEVESGKNANRPELAAAIKMCRDIGATLLIAKLDRLARNVAFTANLLETGVRFVAVDMPNADRFMMHVYAAVAEEEARRISERTRAALAAAKARGVRLGRTGAQLAETNRDTAQRFAAKVGPTIHEWIARDGLTMRAIADKLNDMKIEGARGGLWHAASVCRVHRRFLAT